MPHGSQQHRPVLLSEAIAALRVQPEGCYADCTFGRGGHAAAVLDRLGPDGCLIAFDRDPQAVRAAEERFMDEPRFTMCWSPFSMLEHEIMARGLGGRIDGILLDLGVSSPQFDEPARGFSFERDGPLDMRMDPRTRPSAAEWLSHAPADDIAEVLREYGEERFARRIARAIVAARASEPILTTARLAGVVAAAIPRWEPGKHPATRSFQAIRIFINNELAELQAVLAQSVRVLAKGGRLVVISFHSLEDRLVKRFMRTMSQGDSIPPGLPVPTRALTEGPLAVIGKAVRPCAAEVEANPRARSAIMRVAERR